MRSRNRSQTAIAGLVALVLGAGCATGPQNPPSVGPAGPAPAPRSTSAATSPSTFEPSPLSSTFAASADLPPGARITGTVPVPNSGPLTVGNRAVWVIDRGLAGDATAGLKPVGQLIRIDPRSLDKSVVARNVIGAQVAIDGNSAWIASAILDRLTRVDLQTGRSQRLTTGALTPEMAAAELRAGQDSAENYPYAVVAADGVVWVANHDAGTVARFNSRTGALVASIPVVEPGGSGPANLATDGRRVWVTASRSAAVYEIDAASNEVRTTYDVAPAWACGGSSFDGAHVWVSSGHDAADPCHEDGAWSVSRIDPATGEVIHLDVGGRPMDVEAGLGAVWVVVDKPHPGLVRIDPRTLHVVGRLPLPLVPNITNPMSLGEGAIWIRVVDFWDDGMTPWPGMDTGQPSLLRIEPEG
jgi:hypothetical protein